MGLLSSSYEGAGAATSFARGMSPERMAERSTAYANKEQADQRLKNLKATEPTAQDRENMADAQSLELQNALETQKQMLLQNNKQTSFNAFEHFDVNGDYKYLNNMLTDLSEQGSKLYANVTRIDKLTAMDIPMMKEMGLPDDFINLVINDPEAQRSYVRITAKDGSTSFGDIDVLKGVSGYNIYADTKELARQTKMREIEQMMTLGLDVSKYSSDAFRMAKAELGNSMDTSSPEFREAYMKHYTDLTKRIGVGNRPYRLTEAQDYATRALEDEGISPEDPAYDGRFNEYIAEYRNLAKPSKVKQGEIADTAQQELEDMDFLDMDIKSLSNSQTNKIETTIRRLEQLGGAELGADTRKNLLRIRNLSHLGDKASDLTEKETGLLDNLWFGVKKYIFDEAPPNTDAAAAYALYRNVARHAQFGSVLPAGEIKSFAEAFGSMGMQVGPVLTMLKESLMQLKHDYNAISDLENPYVMKWRTGMGEIELENTINKLDERISMIDTIANDEPIPVTTIPLKPGASDLFESPEDKARLEKILGVDK